MAESVMSLTRHCHAANRQNRGSNSLPPMDFAVCISLHVWMLPFLAKLQ